MKKWFAIGMMIILACLSVTGCVPNEKEIQTEVVSEEMDSQNTLTIWAWDNTFNVKAAELAAEEIQKERPDITVEVVSKEKNEILEKLTNDLSSQLYEELPDIVLIEDYQIQNFLTRYQSEFVDLSEYFDFDLYMDYKVDVSSKDGRHYGIPFDSGTAVMFYRQDYMEQAGFTDADMQNLTWERYIEIGKVVKEKLGVHMLTIEPTDLGVLRIMQQSAGKWYTDEEGHVDIKDNQALSDALDIYLTLLEEDIAYSVSGWDEFVAAFQEGEVATVVSGCWLTSNIKANSQQAGKWRVARIPRMGENTDSVNASNIGGSNWYILKNKPNVSEAIAFMEHTFAHNEEFMNKLIKEINIVSSYKDSEKFTNCLVKDDYFGGQYVAEFFTETVKDIKSVNYGMNTYEIEALMAEKLQTIIKGEDRKDSLQKAQIMAEAIVDVK